MLWFKAPNARKSVLCAYGAILTLFNLFVSSAWAEPIRIMAFGDSLSAGYGLNHDQSFPAQLERSLKADGLDVVVLNAGVSGDTSAGGLARLEWSLAENPQLVILELGANDGLRGLSPQVTQKNLDDIITKLRAENIKVVLTGMLAPPNYGKEFEKEFAAIFPALAQKHQIALYPFFLDGVAAVPHLNQKDRIHPTAEGVAVIVKRIKPLIVEQISILKSPQ